METRSMVPQYTEEKVVVGDQENLPSHCPSCGAAIKDKYLASCEFCSTGVTHMVKKEIPFQAEEKKLESADPFADCKDEDEVGGVNVHLEDEKYLLLEVTGVSVTLTNCTIKELIISGTGVDLSGCTLGTVTVSEATNVTFEDTKVLTEFFVEDSTNVDGEVSLGPDAKKKTDGVNISVKAKRE